MASEIAKVVSREWKALPAEDRVAWEVKASADRDRYYREKAEYKGPLKIPNIKDPRAPKKPMSAFLAFSNERRKAIADANPGMGNAEISGLLSRLWKESPENIREQYRRREAEERKNFKLAFAEWEKKSSNSDMASEKDDKDDVKDVDDDNNANRLPNQSLETQQANVSTINSEIQSTSMGFPNDSFLHQNTNHYTGPGTASLDLTSQIMGMAAQQIIALPPSPFPSPYPGGFPSQPYFSNNASTRSTAGVGSGYTQMNDSPTSDGYQSLDPFIDTDTGGFLAAFAVLEKRDQSNEPPQK